MNKKKRKKPGYWTEGRILNEVKKYCKISHFQNKSFGAYKAAKKLNILDKCLICLKIENFIKDKKRLIYAYEFPNNHVYIGLTFNESKRKSGHLKSGPVFKYKSLTFLEPIYKKLSDLLPSKAAQKAERDFMQLYKKNNWILLNSCPGGALGGGPRKWTFEKCLEIATKYTLNDLKKYKKLVYNAAKKQDWINLLYPQYNF